ncbi:hypothetical protein LARV_01209 [Longilinea arvoryzae]|uniref:Protein containg BNR repeat-like domain n=1 Tax=Longilinea arvoryzae TaxID=360412 RepID=A0A0S7B7S5_9CHLR|nr:sialidase family protein [Longilinea arvoryzae]GAP13455.1 hypothetical protein LARV_01209 [Longilinea arvoryzae]
MSKTVSRFCAILILIIVSGLFPLGVKPAAAQSAPVAWSQPIRLSDPNYQSWPPAIAADIAGNVHILWSQSMLADGTAGNGDTLYYARWNGEKWIGPVDVLVSPGDGLGAEYPDLAATPDGYIHAIWGTGGRNSQLFYARAPACCADDPLNWSKPISLGIAINQTSAIAGDLQGNLYVIYASLDTNDIVFLHSTDSGENWDKAESIPGGTRREDEYPAYPRLSVDESGRIHVVWSILPYPGRAVMYSNSNDGGKTWKDPVIIDQIEPNEYQADFGPTLIDVEAVGRNEVHLTWDGAPTVERHHVWSKDGGETWSEPDTFIPELTGGGRALWNDMAADSRGVLHAVSIKQPWHAQWISGGWSASTAIGQRGFAEDMRIVVSAGNELHVVWLEVRQGIPSTVYYVRGISSAPAVPLKKLPVAASETPLIQPTATGAIESPTLPAPTPLFADAPAADTASVDSPARGVFFGALAVLVFLGLVAYRTWRRKR